MYSTPKLYFCHGSRRSAFPRVSSNNPQNEAGMKLAEISPLVGLSISWISEILRGTNAETGKKTNAKKEYQIKAD